MRAYIIRRLLLMIPTVFLATLVVFFMIRLIPGSIVDMMITEAGRITPQMRHSVEQDLGLDMPIPIQYGRWVGVLPQADGSFSGIFQGDLGKSLWTRTPVIEEILVRVPITLELSIMALIIALLIAIPVGVYSALRQDTWGDYISRSFAIMCIAVPGFWLGTLIIVFPAIWWGYMPPIMYTPFFEDPLANLEQFILPAIVLGMLMSGYTMRMTRTMMLEVLRQDYVRTAWAKGLRERVIVIRHALKNALIPVVTLVGIYMPVLIGGTVIIEKIFCLPGLGSLILDSTSVRDYTLVSGVMIFLAVVIVSTNLLVDLTYGFLDPRVHYQ